ncbi:hypothetical protein MKW98_002450 [Papaver atlanticum]|uniref:Uncharacterized protein n=1 Tax=Papaver atlanticum TaxID=357466 RepID=A0AAD4SCU2_9MAGN|nr:hypothetical protein MKW98_002450 [Papaver atlanticum]
MIRYIDEAATLEYGKVSIAKKPLLHPGDMSLAGCRCASAIWWIVFYFLKKGKNPIQMNVQRVIWTVTSDLYFVCCTSSNRAYVR